MRTLFIVTGGVVMALVGVLLWFTRDEDTVSSEWVKEHRYEKSGW